jgi:hypothetical protein
VGTTTTTQSALAVTAGAVLVLLTLADVFFTVLFPASGRGPVRKPLAWATSRGFRLVAARLRNPRRARFLSYGGPVQVLVTVAAWLALLTLGWALAYWPALGEQLHAASGPTDTSFSTALYYSGFTLSTLGVGDVVAEGATYRMATIVQAATGFTVITMVITYFLSVYSALPSRNAFALRLHHRSLGTDDAAVVVATLVNDSPGAVVEHLAGAADFMRRTLQTHRAYPVLRYFHYREPYYALPVVMLSALDTVALVRSTLDRRRYGDLVHASALEEMSLAAESLLRELLEVDDATRPSPGEVERWRRRQVEAAETMRGRGVAVRSGPEAAGDYVRERAHWNARLAALAEEMAHDWQEELRCPPRRARDDRAGRHTPPSL